MQTRLRLRKPHTSYPLISSCTLANVYTAQVMVHLTQLNVEGSHLPAVRENVKKQTIAEIATRRK